MDISEQEKDLMFEQIEIFEKQTGYSLELKDGRPYSNGWVFCLSDNLPDNLVIDGDLICKLKSKRLPKGLTVNGKLDISANDIIEIPDDCEFKSLDMSHSKITNLRDNLVLDELIAYDSSLIKLPKGLKVSGKLNISETKISEIPNDCEFGSLKMSYTEITKLRDNLVLEHLCVKNSLLTELPKGLKVKGELDVSYTNITKIPDDCVFGELYMVDTKITKLKDNLVLKNLNATKSLLQVLPKGLKVNGWLNISFTNITEIPDDCEFGSLDMSHTKITKLRDNLIVNHLVVDGSSLLELPKNLVVYLSLFASKTRFTTITNDCLIKYVHCDFEVNDERYEKSYYSNYELKNKNLHISYSYGREFIYVDRILSELVEKKGNVYHVRNSAYGAISYLVRDGNDNWAHGKTLDEAKQDLLYKMSVRNKSEYKNLALDSELTFDEAVTCYRVITGACKFGTQDYLEHRLPEPKKERYTIKEMIELTKNEYGGGIFREFFEK